MSLAIIAWAWDIELFASVATATPWRQVIHPEKGELVSAFMTEAMEL